MRQLTLEKNILKYRKQGKTMKYKILLVTSIFATVQFYAYGAEGGSAAAAVAAAAAVEKTDALATMLARLTVKPKDPKKAFLDLASVSKALAGIHSSDSPVISPQPVSTFVFKPSSFPANPVLPRLQTQPRSSVKSSDGMYAAGQTKQDPLFQAGKRKKLKKKSKKQAFRRPVLEEEEEEEEEEEVAQGEPRFFTTDDFTKKELRYMSKVFQITIEEIKDMFRKMMAVPMDRTVKDYKKMYLDTLINEVRGKVFPLFTANDLTQAEKTFLYSAEILTSEKELNIYLRTVGLMDPAERHKKIQEIKIQFLEHKKSQLQRVI